MRKALQTAARLELQGSLAEALTTLTSVLPECQSDDSSMKSYDSSLYPVHNMVGLLKLKTHDLEGAEHHLRRAEEMVRVSSLAGQGDELGRDVLPPPLPTLPPLLLRLPMAPHCSS